MSQLIPDVEQAVAAGVAETFAEMAFLDVVPADAPAPAPQSQSFGITIDGPAKALLYLLLPVSLKRVIVESIHAADWDDLDSESKDDCLLELLNVLGGHIGRILWGEAARCKLSFPEVVVHLPEVDELHSRHDIWFDAEGELFSVVADVRTS